MMYGIINSHYDIARKLSMPIYHVLADLGHNSAKTRMLMNSPQSVTAC